MAKDKYHFLVKRLLENDGWLITHDPFKIMLGKRRGYIDLGAEKLIIAAEKSNEKIAVESDRRRGKKFHRFVRFRCI